MAQLLLNAIILDAFARGQRAAYRLLCGIQRGAGCIILRIAYGFAIFQIVAEVFNAFVSGFNVRQVDDVALDIFHDFALLIEGNAAVAQPCTGDIMHVP